MEREGNSKARSTGNMRESLDGGRSAFRGPTSISRIHFKPVQGNRGSHQRGRSGERSPCPRCGKMHSGICYLELPICYGCGMRGYIQRHCRVSRQGECRGTTQLAIPAAATSSALLQLEGAGTGTAQSSSQAATTSSSPSPAREASPDIVTDQLHEPFLVSTLVWEYIMDTRVYRGCVVMVRGRDTTADLIELGMVDFDIIMGIDWLYSHFSKLDCWTRTMRLEFPDEPIV
uniref:CCHC-type domain-containing protein n=1 Tax=Nicotiana tabacum TaxID=4097 RepID=A0A1S3Z783_TOBAC|nr:PREDICTED: uncharacterized protein LOC107783598 [Nicotiana tabacum]